MDAQQATVLKHSTPENDQNVPVTLCPRCCALSLWLSEPCRSGPTEVSAPNDLSSSFRCSLLPCRRPTQHGTRLQTRCVVTRDIPRGGTRNVQNGMHTGLRSKGHNKRLQLEHCKHTCLLLHLKNHRRILVLRDVTAPHGVALGRVCVGQLVLSGVKGQHGIE